MTPIRVLVADDQALLLDGLCAIFEVEPDIVVVGRAADGAQAVALADTTGPDVAVVDIRMPEMDGIEVTRRLTARATPVAVLVLTTFDLDEYVYEAVRAGASGFLLKDTPRAQLVDAVRRVHAGDALVAPAITRRLLQRFVARPLPGAAPALSQLTDRERDVLRLVAEGLSNAEVAGRLYLSEATVKTHLGHVLAKLGARDRVQAVVAAYESGLVVPGDSAVR